MRRLILTGLSVCLISAFVACRQEEKTPDSGVRTVTDLDVSAYDRWVYFSFETGVPQAVEHTEAEPEKWDLALHRDNVRTNGGAALRTNARDLSDLKEIPIGDYVQDTITYDEVVVDASRMMEGILVYDTVAVNKVLGTWVIRYGMPPVYEVSPNVYVIRNRDGKYAKIKFLSYKSKLDKTGFATFSYEYPFE